MPRLPTGRSSLLHLSLAVLGIPALPGPLPAQTPPLPEWRVALVPVAGVVWSGARHNSREGAGSLGPGSAAHLGAAGEIRLRPTLSLVAEATRSRPSYRLRSGRDGVPDASGGSLTVVRGTLGALYRVRPGAQGFFAGGVILGRVDPRDPVYAREEAPRIEVGAFLGTGLDVGATNRPHLRVEGRLLLSAVGGDPLEGTMDRYRPRDSALDGLLQVGFVLPFLRN